MKCDETRPGCRQCAQKGWLCLGYSAGLKWSYKHQPTTINPIVEQQPGAFMGSSASSELIPPQSKSPNSSAGLPAADDLFPPTGLLQFDSVHADSQQFLDDGFQLALTELGDLQCLPPDTAMTTPHESGAPAGTSSPENSSEPSQITLIQSLELYPQPLLGASSLDRGPDLASRLINNWFDEVCPAWSAFDSGMNMNRKLAADLWPSSAAVFKSLQSMSASFLSARLPQMRQPALGLLKTATLCIQTEVNSINSKPLLDCVPTGLLFSLFCLGTTICWLDSSRVGAPFLKTTKDLLGRVSLQYLTASEDEIEILGFFQKSLVYWEMLISVVDDGDLRSDMDGIVLPGHPQLPTDKAEETSTDLLPHPWTGISAMTSRLFARSMRLCRTYRRRITNPTGRAISLSTAMQEIQEAQRLEEQLLELEFPSISQGNDTGDWRTPWLHLAHVAEAYQLASLLQLYVTFPDLVSLRLPQEADCSGEGDVPWDKWIVPLALRLTRVLEEIPPDSGTRVIQPLLYICASTGLRFNLSPSTSHDANSMCLEIPRSSSSGSNNSDIDILGYINQIDSHRDAGSASSSVPAVVLEIGIARNFIMRRLNVLETSLQPKPIIVAEKLVKAIWDAYDEEPSGCTTVHWLDVMEKTDLRSLFG